MHVLAGNKCDHREMQNVANGIGTEFACEIAVERSQLGCHCRMNVAFSEQRTFYGWVGDSESERNAK